MKKMILPAILVSMTVICAQNGVAQGQNNERIRKEA